MIDKDALFKPRLPEREVEVPGMGTVRVRGLSRSETLQMGKLANEGDLDGSETYLLATGMVEPALDEDEAGAWRQAALADELTPVIDAILDASRLDEEGFKEAVGTFRLDTGDDERLPLGPHAGDDGGPATG